MVREKATINSYMQRLFPDFSDWGFDTDSSGDYITYTLKDGTTHRAQLLGDGVLCMLLICTQLASIRNKDRGMLVIDEPELALHPTAQKELAKMLSEYARYHQVVVCTHSPYFVNWQDFSNGAEFIRLNKHGDRECTMSSLNRRKKYAETIINRHSDFTRPQLWDISAKEIMFATKVLLVEGQVDVGILREILCRSKK